MNFAFKNELLTINGRTVHLVCAAREALADGERLFVLLDPDALLFTTDAKSPGTQPRVTRNLLAFDGDGTRLWEAELPGQADYYYRLESAQPLVAYSFSSYRCQLDPETGRIVRAEFFK